MISNFLIIFNSAVCHQLHYSEHDADAHDNNAEESEEPIREKLVVRLPNPKKGKNAKNESKKSGVGASHGCDGCNGGREHGCGSVPKEPESKTKTKRGGSHRSTRKQGCGGSAGSIDSGTYPVPNYVAVVTDSTGTDKKGYIPPENELAAGLTKYFESRTEIEYNVLIDKMKEVPEGDILKLLGIKSKDTEEEEEPKIEKEDELISPEDEKKADEFMEELKQQAKEELEKANADKKSQGRSNKTTRS